MKIFKTITIILLLVLQAKSQEKLGKVQKENMENNKIPRILWTYWDSGYEGAHLFTKLCINNMQYYTKQSGWEFRFLTKQNLTNYISQKSQEKVRIMIATSKNFILLQNHVDIYRLFLLYENGGMWLDTNSFFVNNLNWIDNIDKELSPYNRIRNGPDIITFTYNELYGGNKTRVIDDKTGEQVYLFPGIEIWSFITKPYSKFLRDVIQNLEYSLITPRVDLDLKNKKIGILYALQFESYFMTSNYQFQTVLQKRQFQIEKNPGKFTEKYAVDYYKIWSIDSLSTAFALFQVNEWTVGTVMESLFHDSIDSFATKYKAEKYFIKFTGDFYPYINTYLPHVQFLTCLKAVKRIQTNSMIYTFLLEPSISMPIIKEIAEISRSNLSQNLECKLFSGENFKSIVFKACMCGFLLLIGNAFIFFMIRKANSKQGKPQSKIEML